MSDTPAADHAVPASVPAPAPVLTEERDGVLLMTLNRPEARNALDRATAEALAAALDTLENRPELRVGVLTGAGGTFSAGMDLKAFARGETPVIPGRGLGGLTRTRLRKPLVAAVEGWPWAGAPNPVKGVKKMRGGSDPRGDLLGALGRDCPRASGRRIVIVMLRSSWAPERHGPHERRRSTRSDPSGGGGTA
jgi:hypothetical protein